MAKSKFFQDPEVAKRYVAVPEVQPDFDIKVPAAKWPPQGNPGKFSTIPLHVAEQLIKEKYDRLALAGSDKVSG